MLIQPLFLQRIINHILAPLPIANQTQPQTDNKKLKQVTKKGLNNNKVPGGTGLKCFPFLLLSCASLHSFN